MIEWIKYDNENPPEKSKVFLTLNKFGHISTGRHIGSWWQHDRYDIVDHKITHYAEINLPE